MESGTAKTLNSPAFSAGAQGAQSLISCQHTRNMQVTQSSATGVPSRLQVPSIIAVETTFPGLLHVALFPFYPFQRLSEYRHAPTAQLAVDDDHVGRVVTGGSHAIASVETIVGSPALGACRASLRAWGDSPPRRHVDRLVRWSAGRGVTPVAPPSPSSSVPSSW